MNRRAIAGLTAIASLFIAVRSCQDAVAIAREFSCTCGTQPYNVLSDMYETVPLLLAGIYAVCMVRGKPLMGFTVVRLPVACASAAYLVSLFCIEML